MSTEAPLSARTHSDSPHSARLRDANPNRRFAAELEAEYVRGHLRHSRTLIRTAAVLSLLLAISRTTEQLFTGSPSATLLFHAGLIVCGSAVLTWLAWGPAFEKSYLPWAQVIVPIRNAIAAAHFAEAAASGHWDVLMILPLMLIGPFFFMGLRFRTALLAGVLTTSSFILFSAVFGLALPLAIRTGSFLIIGLVGCAAGALRYEKRSRISFLENHLVLELAQYDALTGTKNRRVFDEHLARVWRQAAQHQRVLAIVLLDVDHFKAYNDRYGHLAGDEALRRIAQTLKGFVNRPLDVLARYGGEEFAAVLYDVEANQAVAIAERMRLAVQSLGVEHRASRTAMTITISAGVAAVQPTLSRDCRGALQLADQALYDGKVKGRNRVELLDDTQYQMLVTGVFAQQVGEEGLRKIIAR